MLTQVNQHITNSISAEAQGAGRMLVTWRGCRVGLLGGSFDPPHAGHLHVARLALRRLRLDQVWLLVSPGNPLKVAPEWPFQRRLDAAGELAAQHPKIAATDLEQRLGTVRTVATLRSLRRRMPTARFVWLMGSDSFAMVHCWQDWASIFHLVPIAVFGRPGSVAAAGRSVAAQRFAQHRLRARDAIDLTRATPPCWCLLTGATVHDSSTQLRLEAEA